MFHIMLLGDIVLRIVYQGQFCKDSFKRIDIELAPLCLLWCIWRERNARLFEDVETSMVELRKRLLNTLYIWIASHHSLNIFTYVDFLKLFYVRPF
jgi:hypothetical protein